MKTRLLISICCLVLGSHASAQETQSFADATKGLKAKAEASRLELTELQKEIREEKVPLNNRLRSLQEELDDARAFVCDLGDLNLLSKVVDRIRADMGPPDVLIHNAVSASFKMAKNN